MAKKKKKQKVWKSQPSKTRAYMREIYFYKITHKFCQQTCFVKKQVQLTS